MAQSLDRIKYAPQIKTAAFHEQPLKKEAAIGLGMSGVGGGGSVVRVNPKPYSPIYDESYLMLPRDRRELNQWCRHFYATDPIIRNAIDLHTRYPLSKFDIRCPYPKIRSFFEDLAERTNLHEIMLGIGLEYWKIGEVFPEAELDKTKGVWTNIYIHNPDYIDVKDMPFLQEPLIMLIPDDETRRIIKSPNQDDIAIRSQIDPEVIEYVMTGQNIPLNNFNVSFVVNKASPYDKRGTSQLECLFKDLMLRDKYREAQYVIADAHVTPLKIFKLGNDKYRPTPSELEAFRDTLEEATYDPNFSIVFHDALAVEYVGSNGVILDLSGEYDRLERMFFTGLFTSQTIAAGDGPTYSGTEVALDVLQQRYISFRQKIRHWVERKIFRPIAEINDFYEYDPETGDKKLIVPEVSWHKINLKTSKDYIDTLNGLAESKKCSYTRVFEMLDLDFEEELNLIETEQKHIKKLEDALKEMGAGEEGGEDSGGLGDLDMGGGDAGGGDLGGGLGGGTDLGGGEATGETPEAGGEPAPEAAPPAGGEETPAP